MLSKSQAEINRSIKITLIVLFIIISTALIISHDNPVSGYEASIYNSTPLIFWAAIVISIIFALIVILFIYFKYSSIYKNILYPTIALVLFCYACCLSIFIVRNYYLWNAGGDVSTHIMYINDILKSGHISNILFYPITHILVVEQAQILSADVYKLSMVVPFFFSLLYILNMYVLSKYVLKSKKQAIIATILACTFTSGWYISLTPNLLANLMFPLILLIILKCIGGHRAFNVLALICVIVLPPFHVISAIALLIFFFSVTVVMYILKFLNVVEYNKVNVKLLIQMLFLFLWSTVWVFNYRIGDWAVINFYRFISQGSTSNIQIMESQMAYAQSYGYNVLDHVLKLYGSQLVLIILAIIGIALIIKNHQTIKQHLLVYTFGPIACFVGVIIVASFVNTGFSPMRFIYYIIILCIILSAYTIDYILSFSKRANNGLRRMVLAGAITIVIILIFINSIMTLYPSPYILSHSYQTAKSEINGMGWMVYSTYDIAPITTIQLWPYRYVGLNISDDIRNYNMTELSKPVSLKIPFHFNYENDTSLSTSFANETFMVTTILDKSIYNDVYPEMAKYRFNNTDFAMLNYDRGLNKLYTNGAFDGWLIL